MALLLHSIGGTAKGNGYLRLFRFDESWHMQDKEISPKRAPSVLLYITKISDCIAYTRKPRFVSDIGTRDAEADR